MKSGVDIVFRDIDFSPTLNEQILKKLGKLNRYTDKILNSRVVIDTPHKNKLKGNLYRASIELGMSGDIVVAAKDHDSIYVAVRDAFKTIERKIKERSMRERRSRGIISETGAI